MRRVPPPAPGPSAYASVPTQMPSSPPSRHHRYASSEQSHQSGYYGSPPPSQEEHVGLMARRRDYTTQGVATGSIGGGYGPVSSNSNVQSIVVLTIALAISTHKLRPDSAKADSATCPMHPPTFQKRPLQPSLQHQLRSPYPHEPTPSDTSGTQRTQTSTTPSTIPTQSETLFWTSSGLSSHGEAGQTLA